MPIIVDTGVDNAGLRAGLTQAESMVAASIRRMSAMGATIGTRFGSGTQFITAHSTQLGQLSTMMGRATGAADKLSQSMSKMGGLFTSGLGIGVTIGGFVLLEQAFSKAIRMAEKFQTAQLSINALLLSGYKVTDQTDKAASPAKSFLYVQEQSTKYNKEIIERARKNILTYEEQLQSFQTGLAAGSRKGLMPKQVMDITEDIAVAAKAIGLRGERISEQVRILLGGGVNVQRSMLAKMLHISTQDISARGGGELMAFIGQKLKGFQAPEVKRSFSESIEATITTLTSQVDVSLAGVGKKIMKGLTPAIKDLGTFLESPQAEKLGDSLTKLFLGLFKGLETIAKSPAIPKLVSFFEFLVKYADKIVIGAVLLKVVGVLFSAIGVATKFSETLGKMGVTAAVTAKSVDGLTAAAERNTVVMAGGGGIVGGVPLASRMGPKGVAGGTAIAAETGALSAAQEAAIIGVMAGGTPRAVALARGMAKGALQRKIAAGKFGTVGSIGYTASQESYLAGMPASPGMVARAEMDTWLLAQEGAVAAEGVRAGSLRGRIGDTAKRARTWAGGIGSKAGAFETGGKMAKGGMYALIGTQLASMAVPQKVQQTPEYGMATTGIIGAATMAPLLGKAAGAVGGLEVGAGALPLSGIATAGGAAGVAGMSALILSAGIVGYGLGGGLRKWRMDMPAAKQDKQLYDEWIKNKPKDYNLKQLKQQMHLGLAELNKTGEAYVPWLGKKGGTKQAIESYLKQIDARIAGGETDEYRFEPTEKAASETARRLAFWQGASKTAAMGFGRKGKGKGGDVEVATQLQLAELESARSKFEIRPVDADLIKRYQAGEAKKASIDAETAKLGSKIRPPAEIEATKKARSAANEEMDAAITEQYSRTKKQILQHKKYTSKLEDFGTAEQKAELDIRPVEGEYARGKLAVQRKITEKVISGDIELSEAPGMLKKALANFELIFNKPLKEIEQKISNLSLGVSSENVIEAAELAFKAVREKIQAAINLFKATGGVAGISPEEAEKYRAQNAEQLRAIGVQEEYTAPRRLGLFATAQSSVVQQEAAGQATMAGAFRMPETASAYGLISQIEGQRKAGNMLPDQFERFQAESIRQAQLGLQRNEEARALEQRQFTLGSKLSEAGFNPENARMMQMAQDKVGREQPRITFAEAETMVREGIDIQRKQNEIMSKIKWEDYAKAINDTIEANKVWAKYLQGIVGNVTTPGSKKTPIGGNQKDSTSITMNIAPTATFTEKDVDQWMPKIREKLCRLATQSGGRG